MFVTSAGTFVVAPQAVLPQATTRRFAGIGDTARLATELVATPPKFETVTELEPALVVRTRSEQQRINLLREQAIAIGGCEDLTR